MEIQLSPLKNKFPARIIAIILGAGKGTRIEHVFPSTPKPLIKISSLGEVSVLDHLISTLLDLRIDLIEIIIGHLGYKIENHIRNLKEKDKNRYSNVGLIDSGQEYKKGSFFSFLSFSKNLSKYFSRDLFLIIPGDTIFSKGIFVNIFHLIAENGNLFRKYPSIFYQDLKQNEVKPIPKHSISILETFSGEKNFFLKKIVQIDNEIQNLDKIKQVVPIISFPYNFVITIIKQAKKMNVISIKDTLNFLIETQDQKIMVYKLSSKYRFYDIDSESDLINLEKKVDNSCSD